MTAKRPAMPAGVVHRGGGWYELPDGARVRGVESAREALARLAAKARAAEADQTVAQAVEKLIAGLDPVEGLALLHRNTLAAEARALAKALDDAERPPAPINRELRATVEALVADEEFADPRATVPDSSAGDDDDDDPEREAFARWEDQLNAAD